MVVRFHVQVHVVRRAFQVVPSAVGIIVVEVVVVRAQKIALVYVRVIVLRPVVVGVANHVRGIAKASVPPFVHQHATVRV